VSDAVREPMARSLYAPAKSQIANQEVNMSRVPRANWKGYGFALFVSRKGKYRNITLKSTGEGSGKARLYQVLTSPHRVKASFKSLSK
jgi:hypothetical protein